MRRSVTLSLAGALLAAAAGCGNGSTTLSSNYNAVLAATASKTTQAGSSRIALTSQTSVSGQQVSFTGDGAFTFGANQSGQLNLTLSGMTPGGSDLTIGELLTGGNIYLSLPNQPGYYRIKLSDLVGTQLAQSSDPSSSLAALAGVSGAITKVGTETVRGTSTTHLQGVIDVHKAINNVPAALRPMVQGLMTKGGVSSIPFDAFIDNQGRMRRFVEHLVLTIGAQSGTSTTTVEFYGFGTKVSVTAPPDSQVHDGSALLAALKRAG